MTELKPTKQILEDDVKLKICVIGAGNAGNQVVVKAYKKNHQVFAINSSIKDLSDEVLNSAIPSFIVGNEARGAGKNRTYGKQLFKKNGKELFQLPAFINMVEESDIVIVAASTAGGTGSAVAPEVIKILKQLYPRKIVIFFGVTPKISDSIMSQTNHIQCMEEITSLNCPYQLADLSNYEDTPNDIAYESIGEYFTECINVIRGDYLHYSDNGMIDENDMRVLIGEPGHQAIYIMKSVTQDQIDKQSVQSHMIGKVKQNPSMQIQRDGIVRQMGIIMNFPEQMMETARTGNYNELADYIGTPITIFENYALSNKPGGEFILILSGMTMPYNKIQQSKQKIMDNEAKLQRNTNLNLMDDVDDISFVKNIQNSGFSLEEPEEEDAKADILGNFFD